MCSSFGMWLLSLRVRLQHALKLQKEMFITVCPYYEIPKYELYFFSDYRVISGDMFPELLHNTVLPIRINSRNASISFKTSDI
jgi:hypothetical protein